MARKKEQPDAPGNHHPMSGLMGRIRELAGILGPLEKAMEAMWDNEEQQEVLQELAELHATLSKEAAELGAIIKAVQQQATMRKDG